MHKKTFFLLLFLLAPLPASAVSLSQEQLEAFIGEVLDGLSNEDYYGLAKMFHYPPEYQGEVLRKDECSVRSNIEVMVSAFGGVQSAKPLDVGSSYHSYDIGGGDHSYWQLHKDALEIPVEASFTTVGSGVIKLQIVDISGKAQLRILGYGQKVGLANADVVMNGLKQLMAQSRKERIEKSLCK